MRKIDGWISQRRSRVIRILRHSNLATTMNVYVKTVSEDSVNAMKALEALMCADRAPEKSEIDTPVVN